MANYRVATASDYANLLESYNKDIEGVSQWEKLFLQPLQESTQASANAVTSQANYDISSAYANYKKNQMALMSSSLGTGYKQQTSENLLSNYKSQYSNIKTEEATNLADISSSYLSSLATEEETLSTQGQNMADLENAIYNFAGISDTSSMYSSDTSTGGLGYYSLDASGNMTLTDAGKNFFDKAMNYGVDTVDEEGNVTHTSFEDYLSENNSELYDFYVTNKSTINQLVGGLKPSDISYTQEEAQAETNRLNAEQIKQNAIDIFGTSEGLEQYENTPVTTLTSRTNKAGNIVVNNQDISINNKNYVATTEPTEDISKSLTSKFSNFKVGDVAYYQGNLYVLSTQTAPASKGQGRGTSTRRWFKLTQE